MAIAIPSLNQGAWGPVNNAALQNLDDRVTDLEAVEGISTGLEERVRAALTFFYPEDHGAVGDGITNDYVAIQAAIDAAHAAGGGIVWITKRYAWSGTLIHRGGVHVIGGGVRRVPGTPDTLDRGLVALDGTSVYQYGAWGSGSVDDNPGRIEGLNIDGNGVGGTSGVGALFTMQCVDGAIVDCRIVNSAGHAVEVGGSQNSAFERCVIGYSTGRAISVMQAGGQGAGQVKFNNCYVSDSRTLLYMDGDPAYFPSHDITFNQCLFELHVGGNDIADLRAGDIRFRGCVFTNSNASTMPNDAIVKISQDTYPSFSTTVTFDGCWWNGGSNADKPSGAVRIKSASGGVGNIVRFFGHSQITNCDAMIAVEGATVASDITIDGTQYLGSGVAVYNTTPGGSLFGVMKTLRGPLRFSIPDDSSGSLHAPLMLRRATDTQDRFILGRDGDEYYFDGSSTTVRASKVRNVTDNAIELGGFWRFQNGVVHRPILLANVTTAGQSVSFSGAAAAAPVQVVQFTVNGASGNATISGGLTGSYLEVQLDATALTAGQTASITWPAAMITAASSLPQPVQGKVVSIAFRYNGTSWIEIARNTGSSGSGAASTSPLSRTAVKTANYTTALWELVPCDTSGGSFTVTIPAASTGQGRICVKLVTGTNTLNLALSGSDHFNTSAGPTTGTLTLANQAIVLESDGSGIWTITADDLPLSALDSRYAIVRTGTTATAAATAAKTATITGYTPAAGDELALTLTNGNTVGAPTLNINSGGAVGIYIGGAVADLAQVFSGANAIWKLRYDGSRWNLIGAQSNFTQATTAEMQAGTATSVRWMNPALVGSAVTTLGAVVAANTQSGTSYTLAATDQGKKIRTTSTSAVTITVPPNSSVPFPVGTTIPIIQVGGGSGQVTVAPGAGVTIRTAASSTTRAQYSEISLWYEGSDVWYLSGDLT